MRLPFFCLFLGILSEILSEIKSNYKKDICMQKMKVLYFLIYFSPEKRVRGHNMDNIFDYYYGDEGEQFSYIRIPKLLIKDEKFRALSDRAKMLYGILLDRMSLSRQNKWLDDENRVYIFFPIAEITKELNCTAPTACKAMAELDAEEGIGLIERKKRGQGKPDIIYVKNFVGASGLYGAEQKEHKSKNSNSFNSRNKKILNAEINEFKSNNNYRNKNDNNKTEVNSQSDSKFAVNVDENLRDNIRIQIQEKRLKNEYPDKKNYINHIIELIASVLQDEKGFYVNKQWHEYAEVRVSFQKISFENIKYIIDKIAIDNEEIRDKDKYILSALFNVVNESVAKLKCHVERSGDFNRMQRRHYDMDALLKAARVN